MILHQLATVLGVFFRPNASDDRPSIDPRAHLPLPKVLAMRPMKLVLDVHIIVVSLADLLLGRLVGETIVPIHSVEEVVLLQVILHQVGVVFIKTVGRHPHGQHDIELAVFCASFCRAVAAILPVNVVVHAACWINTGAGDDVDDASGHQGDASSDDGNGEDEEGVPEEVELRGPLVSPC